MKPLSPQALAQPLGLKKSFGFGDRLGLATPGHLDAAKKYDFAPIFAQQSIREMQRTQRTPHDVMTAAQNGLLTENYDGIWGADADHLKTPEDIEATAAAGFCFFTIDPSQGVNNGADAMSQSELEDEMAAQKSDGVWNGFSAHEYLEQKWEIQGQTLKFSIQSLQRAVAKYGRAVALAADLGAHIEKTCAGHPSGAKPFEIEVSVDETEAPTSPLEHLFFALELKRRGLKNLVSLAPRFVGEMEKGIDYKGDLAEFEEELQKHAAIARLVGPYKISVHSGSDKFSIYPIVGRVCGELLHVKTAGTSYLEALRVAARAQPDLFREICAFSHARFDEDRQTYHISTTQTEAEQLSRAAVNFGAREVETAYLDEIIGRQVLHVTFGSVLITGRDSAGAAFKARLLDLLEARPDLHREFLGAHFERHLGALNAG